MKNTILVLIFLFWAVSSQNPVTDTKTVVFRYDDLQAYWLNDAQAAVMDKFTDKGVKLSVGIISQNFYDQIPLNAVRRGLQKSLFEVWDHTVSHKDLTKQTHDGQVNEIGNCYDMIENTFGIKAKALAPPYNAYNADTMTIMESYGMNIISAERGGLYPQACVNSDFADNKMYFAPAGASTDTWSNSFSFKANDLILKEIQDQYEECKYAVVMMHPQNFVDHAAQKGVVQDYIDRLGDLIDLVLNDGFTAGHFTDIYNSGDDNLAPLLGDSELLQEVPDSTAPAWEEGQTYNYDDVVSHNGADWRAQWQTTAEPGTEGSWQEIVQQGDEWRENHIYDYGDTATYEGVLYRAKYWTRGDVPSESDQWETVNLVQFQQKSKHLRGQKKTKTV